MKTNTFNLALTIILVMFCACDHSILTGDWIDRANENGLTKSSNEPRSPDDPELFTKGIPTMWYNKYVKTTNTPEIMESQMVDGISIKPGKSYDFPIQINAENYALIGNSNGNLLIKDKVNNTILWESQSTEYKNNAKYYLTFQYDGNLVIYRTYFNNSGNREAIWATMNLYLPSGDWNGSYPRLFEKAFYKFQKNGNLVLYWQTAEEKFMGVNKYQPIVHTGTAAGAISPFLGCISRYTTNFPDCQQIFMKGIPKKWYDKYVVLANNPELTDSQMLDGTIIKPGKAYDFPMQINAGNYMLIGESNGNLCIKNKLNNKVLWESRSAQNGSQYSYKMIFQNDGNLVIYLINQYNMSDNSAIWSTENLYLPSANWNGNYPRLSESAFYKFQTNGNLALYWQTADIIHDAVNKYQPIVHTGTASGALSTYFGQIADNTNKFTNN